MVLYENVFTCVTLCENDVLGVRIIVWYQETAFASKNITKAELIINKNNYAWPSSLPLKRTISAAYFTIGIN